MGAGGQPISRPDELPGGCAKYIGADELLGGTSAAALPRDCTGLGPNAF